MPLHASQSQILKSRPLFVKMACKQNLDLRCVLISGPSTLGAGAKTRLESIIKQFTPHCFYRPPALLKEILLVDDTGGREPQWLKDPKMLVRLQKQNKKQKENQCGVNFFILDPRRVWLQHPRCWDQYISHMQILLASRFEKKGAAGRV